MRITIATVGTRGTCSHTSRWGEGCSEQDTL